MRRVYFLIILFLLAVSFRINAGVNIKNGNYYKIFYDIVFNRSTMNLRIERTYNSLLANEEMGWFGAGWSSEYETCLHTMPGGGAVIQWWGYQWTYYQPAEWDMTEISTAVDSIVELEKESGSVRTPDDILNLRTKLLNNMDLRYAYWKKYLARGKFQEYRMHSGSRLSTVSGTFSQVLVTDSGFYSVMPADSTKYFFNASGKLVRKTDPDGNFLVLSYDTTGMIRFISDSDSNLLTFTFENNGRVLRVEDQDHRYAAYQYDENQNLIFNRDMDNFRFWHSYDSKHHMTSISYEDGSKVEMEYDDNGSISKVKEKDGAVWEYKYYSNSDLDYGTLVMNKNPMDSLINKTLYWYTYQRSEIGKKYMRRLFQVSNDTDTLIRIYDDRYALDSLVHNDTTWNFQYSVKGELVRVTDNQGNWMEPEKRIEGIARITDQDGWMAFDYDLDGKPTVVRTSDGLEIPYPYPADKLELQAAIQRIRYDVRILRYAIGWGVVDKWL